MNAQQWWQRGRDAEALGTPAGFAEALRCFDAARALLTDPAGDPESVRLLGRVWMNRGNLLQRQETVAALDDAIRAYDTALTVLGALPADPVVQNHLDAAWLNRGHALRRFADAGHLAAAAHSFREAIARLRPLAAAQAEPSAPANLAGALINLADTLLAGDAPDRLATASTAAHEALTLTAAQESAQPLWAELGLMARRAQAMALGRQLAIAYAPDLVGEASDTIEGGLALIRRWDTAEHHPFQPFARRFFRFGVELYRRHQTHFLAEFVLETLASPDTPPAWAADRDLQVAALEAVAAAIQDLREPQILIAGDPITERVLATHRTLMLTHARLRSLFDQDGSGGTA